jgi:hypothetical protein
MVTAMSAAIAFQWTISNDLPKVGYLTAVDNIFYLNYLLIMVSMIQSVWTYHLDKKGNTNLSVRFEGIGRFLIPFIL